MLTPEIRAVIDSPQTSHWLKRSLLAALERDVVDATYDAELLAQLLRERCERCLKPLPLSR